MAEEWLELWDKMHNLQRDDSNIMSTLENEIMSTFESSENMPVLMDQMDVYVRQTNETEIITPSGPEIKPDFQNKPTSEFESESKWKPLNQVGVSVYTLERNDTDSLSTSESENLSEEFEEEDMSAHDSISEFETENASISENDSMIESESEQISNSDEEMSSDDDKIKHIVDTLEKDGEAGLQKLIQEGYDLHAARPGKEWYIPRVSYTPLHEASLEGKHRAMELLLRAGRWLDKF